MADAKAAMQMRCPRRRDCGARGGCGRSSNLQSEGGLSRPSFGLSVLAPVVGARGRVGARYGVTNFRPR